MPQVHGKQIKNSTITPPKIDLSTASAGTDPASRQFVADSIANSVFGASDWKQSVRAATTANITLTGAQTIDTVSVIAGDRVLVKNQTTASGNGIYVVASGSWTRAADADSAGDISPGMIVTVEEGGQANTTWRCTNSGAITIGTTSINFAAFSTFSSAVPTQSNKGMAALLTTNDNDLACNTGVTTTPSSASYIAVEINGVNILLGNGAKTNCDAYFSGDTGTTARALNAVASGDKLYWVGSYAGYQLATTDIVDFFYVV